MFLEKIKSPGLAHLSYIIGTKKQAAVVDPRRDIAIYLHIARQKGIKITHIFETHRNEDYVIGSIPLANQTGAQIYHGHATDFNYGEKVHHNQSFELGDLKLTVLETPGHTFESISIAASDTSFSDDPILVFTGDALFIGDVGRTDFFPDRAEEVAGLLYDSIFNVLLPLGDHVILCPAHGAGSVCGSGMAAREFSTLGYERKHNKPLQLKDKNDFIEYKVNEHHYKPPYFKQMEQYNQYGPPLVGKPAVVQPMDPDTFESNLNGDMFLIDTRSPESFAGAFIPGAISIPMKMVPAFAGWFVPYDKPIGLVLEQTADLDTAVTHLYRIGYDNIVGYLEGGMHAWETSGKKYNSIPAIHVEQLSARIDQDLNFTLLDVRSVDEFEQGHLPGATNIYVGQLPQHLNKLDTKIKVTTFCGSGRRAMIAASVLKKNGFNDVEDCLGSMKACAKVGCPQA